MMVCGLPNLICGLVMLFCMPESPKFSFSNGDEQKTLKILKGVYSINTGNHEDTFEVKSLVHDKEFEQSCRGKTKSLIEFVWSQTAPLFKHPHLRNTLTICFIQFCIFNSSNGFWSFFPEITNRIAIWGDSNPSNTRATLCEVLDETKIVLNSNGTLNDPILCVTKLETSTFTNAYVLNVAYTLGWFLIATIINCAGKLVIITTLLFSCGICGFSMIFVNIPIVSNYLYIILLCDGLALVVLNACSVELFPTQFRFARFII